MTGLCTEVGNDLRNLCHAPADKANDSKCERDFVVQVTETVIEVSLHPSHTCLLLLQAVTCIHHLSIYLALSLYVCNCVGMFIYLSWLFYRIIGKENDKSYKGDRRERYYVY